MKVLVIGTGAREHALAWKLSQDPQVTVLCSPGNDGMAASFKCIVPPVGTPDCYLQIAQDQHADLTVVGPEAPLTQGIVDRFQEKGLLIFGPNQAAAMITEGSKIACKKMLTRANVPTAPWRAFTDSHSAISFIKTLPTEKSWSRPMG